MSDWSQRRLRDLLALDYGSSLPADARSGAAFPVYGSSGQVGTHHAPLVDGPGIVVGRKGTVGAVSWSERSFWPIDTTYYARSFGSDLRWLFWLLRSLPLSRLDSSTGVPGLNRNDAYEMTVKVPPLPEQRRIAEILDTIDEAIRKTEGIIVKLEQVKQGLLHDLLTRGIDDNGELRNPDRHPKQFKDSPLGRVPKAWELTILGEIAAVDRGKFTHRPRNDPAYYGGRFPFIQTGDITGAEGRVLTSHSQSLNEKGVSVSREFPTGTIAITIAANIADTAILGIPMYFPDSVVGAIVSSPNSVRFTQLCIQRAKRRLDARAPQSAQKNINLQDLRPLLIPHPAPQEQARVAAVYDTLLCRLTLERKSLAKLTALKQGLMEDLLTGSVRVTALLEEAAE